MRALGALGKLHNLAVHMRSSAGRASVFRALAGRLLPIDNRTRWNSWSTMLTVACEKQVAITRYQSDFEEEIETEDILQAPTDWKELQAIRDFLNIFEEATLRLQGNQARIHKVLPIMDALKITLSKVAQNVSLIPLL